MDTAKPLNPSNKVGEADDLIEELARMMAEGAKGGASNSPTPPQSASARPNPAIVTGGGPNANLPTSNDPAPSNDSAPVATSRPGGGGADVSQPKFSPVPGNFSSSLPTPAEPAASADFKFDLGGGIQANAPTAAPSNHSTEGLQASTQQKPIEPPSRIVNAGSGVAIPNEPPNDPIADLIRDRLQDDPTQTGLQQDDQRNQNEGTPTPSATQQTLEPKAAASEAQNTAPDSFKVPPVFGLGGPPSTTPPSSVAPVSTQSRDKSIGSSDALDEIEKLIGNAVRVDFPRDASAQQAVEGPPASQTPPVPQPAESSPQAAAIAPPPAHAAGAKADTNVDAAEAAILQAMGASGAPSAAAPTVETSFQTQELPQEPLLAGAQVQSGQDRNRTVKRYLVPAVAALLLVGAGVTGYFVLNSGSGEGDAPVLLADVTPTKQDPVPASTTVEDQSVVFDGIDGNSVPEEEQRLLSRDETNGATGSEIRQVVTADNTEAGLANRRVRTVTVRPDGTIISGDDAVAGGEILPVAQPDLPELPAGAVNTELANTTVAALPAATSLTNSSLSSLAPNSETLTVNGTTIPFPQPRVSDRSALAASAANNFVQPPQTITLALPASEIGSPAQTLTAPPPVSSNPGAVDLIATLAAESVVEEPAPVVVITPPPVEVVTPIQQATNPTAFVQLASLRRQDVAEETAANLQSRYSSSLQGGTLEVRRVDLGERGIFFRVLLPSATLADATSVCGAIQNAGGDCFPRNN